MSKSVLPEGYDPGSPHLTAEPLTPVERHEMFCHRPPHVMADHWALIYRYEATVRAQEQQLGGEQAAGARAETLLGRIAEPCGWLHRINEHDPPLSYCAECELYREAALAGEEGR